jgi:hypothetical protein
VLGRSKDTKIHHPTKRKKKKNNVQDDRDSTAGLDKHTSSSSSYMRRLCLTEPRRIPATITVEIVHRKGG